VAAAGAAVYLTFALALYVLIQGDQPHHDSLHHLAIRGKRRRHGSPAVRENPVWKVVLLLLFAY